MFHFETKHRSVNKHCSETKPDSLLGKKIRGRGYGLKQTANLKMEFILLCHVQFFLGLIFGFGYVILLL